MNVAQKEGFDRYIPTIMIRATRQILLVEGIPEDVDHRDAIQNVITRDRLETQEFFFGVRTGKDEITTGHYTPNGVEFMTIIKSETGYSVQPLLACGWWRVAPAPG
jgi:hypothetical protein